MIQPCSNNENVFLVVVIVSLLIKVSLANLRIIKSVTRLVNGGRRKENGGAH